MITNIINIDSRSFVCNQTFSFLSEGNIFRPNKGIMPDRFNSISEPEDFPYSSIGMLPFEPEATDNSREESGKTINTPAE